MSIRWYTYSTVFFLLLSQFAFAAIPTTVHYQGFLTDSGGTPGNTPVDMSFSLYTVSTGGTAGWTEAHSSVSVNKGVFNVKLGSVSPFPADFFDEALYLGITIGTDVEMTPRLEMSATPYAFTSENVVACSAGLTNCSSNCADLQTDANNCGTCGTACNTGAGEVCAAGICTTDGDGDGYDSITAGGTDCDDGNASTNPGAAEICDGIDNNCSAGITDDGVSEPWLGISCDGPDSDLCNEGVYTCVAGTQTCNDTTSGNLEVCDGIDNDCNGSTDDGVPGNGSACSTGMPGVCSAGMLNCISGVFSCMQTQPSGGEICDFQDNDCDGLIDEDYNLQTDINNCGACGNVCLSGICSSGVCEFL